MINIVRRANENDIPALLELLGQVNRVHHEGRPDLFKLTTKFTEDELKNILVNDQTPVFVCEDENGRILGHAFCELHHPANTVLMNDILTMHIDDICVDETMRGQHVGKTLYEHVAAYACQCGCYNVTLNVWSCNPAAQAFYEKMGMSPQKIGMETIL